MFTPEIIRVKPSDDVGKVVAAKPFGHTYLFAPGLYRELNINTRLGDTFVGDSHDQEAVVLSGAVVIEAGDIKKDGAFYVAAGRAEEARCTRAAHYKLRAGNSFRTACAT